MGKNEILGIVFLFLIYPLGLRGQSQKTSEEIIKKSFEVFCDSIVENDKLFDNAKFYFSGLVSSKYPNMVMVALCADYITFSEMLNINESEIEEKYNVKKIELDSSILLSKERLPMAKWFRRKFMKGYYFLEVQQPIKFDKFYIVNFYLLSKAPSEIYLSFKFNMELGYEGYCLEYLDL